MKAEVIGWVATAVGSPIVIVTLCWTLVIFHCHRQYWRSTDLLIVAILSQGVVKQIATFAYTVLTLLQTLGSNETWCSAIVWLLTSVHILQAGTLPTLVLSRLVAVRSPLKYRQTFKRTHIVYHLVSLSVLSSCIGLAAVLAEKKDHGLQEVTNSTVSSYDMKTQHCTFLPHEMDQRYAIFSITVHSLLGTMSLVALIITLFSWCCLYRRQKSNISVSQPSTMIGSHGNQKRQLLTSSSDLSAMSDISVTSTARNGGSTTQNGGSGGSEGRRNVDILPGKCTMNDSHFMNGLMASNLRYNENGDGKLQATMTYATPPPKTASLDALPTLSCSNGFGSALKSASDANCFRSNANNAFHTVFPNSSGHVINSSNDTLKSCAVISSYNHTAPKSLAKNGSNYETYDRNCIAPGNGNTEDGCRWTSESSYISTSTSSTNSRAPCLARDDGVVVEHEDLRLPSMISMLVLCYVINHLPVLGLTAVGMFAPWLLPQLWSLPALVLWAGLAEECLLPILLSLCDRNFTAWVANIYTYRDRRVADLARQHQGLDGKFRVFSTHSQNQTEIQSSNQLQSQQQHQPLQQEPVKFPITNGSLFTSVDGRLPIIHNYRRGMRTNGAVPSQVISMGLPVAQTRRHELLQRLISLNTAAIENQHSELFKQRTPDETCKIPQNFTEKTCDFQAYLQTGMDTIEKKVANQITHNCRQRNETGSVLTDFGIENMNSEQPSSDCEDYLNSEGLNEYNVDDDDDDDDDNEPIYATLSSRSCCSATTAANDDFEFFQHEEKFSKLVNNNTEKGIMPQMPENNFLCGSQSEEENSDQSLPYRYQREMVGTGDCVHQGCQCTDWTVNHNNEVLKLVLPLIESYQNQNGNVELSYHNNEINNGKNVSHSKTITQNASEILRTVIQNELKNSTSNAFKKGTNCSTGSTSSGTESKSKDNSCSHHNGSNTNSKNLQSSCEQYFEAEGQKEIISPRSSCENLKLQVTNITRKKRVKQNMLAGSLSLNNLDELLLEKDEDDLVVQRRNSRKSSNAKMRNRPQNDPNSSDEREVIFELPVKSESVLSLYRLDLDAESRSSEPTVTDLSCKDINNRRFHKQIPGNRRILGQPPARRLGQQTPPMRRLRRQKQLPVPVLSVESLTTALTCAGVSYLDNGDLCRHGSVPDLQKVFVSDYI